jgi:hypothetical protein
MPDRDKALTIIEQIEREAEARGFEKGVQAGFERAMKIVDEAYFDLQDKLTDGYVGLDDTKPPPPELKGTLRQMARSRPQPKKPSGKATVLSLVQRNPGYGILKDEH